jgi:hypothetical protein
LASAVSIRFRQKQGLAHRRCVTLAIRAHLDVENGMTECEMGDLDKAICARLSWKLISPMFRRSLSALNPENVAAPHPPDFATAVALRMFGERPELLIATSRSPGRRRSSSLCSSPSVLLHQIQDITKFVGYDQSNQHHDRQKQYLIIRNQSCKGQRSNNISVSLILNMRGRERQQFFRRQGHTRAA